MFRGLGYTFGVFIGIPFLLIIVNFLFFRGNQVSENEVAKYIVESRVIEVVVPRGIIPISEGYYPKLTQGNNVKRIFRTIFYSEEHHKFMILITFKGYDFRGKYNHDNNMIRNTIIYSGGVFLVRANKAQWNDPAYGTEANPVPVFGVKVIENGLREPQVEFDVPDNLNRIFVEQYLDHFLSKEDFKKLFG